MSETETTTLCFLVRPKFGSGEAEVCLAPKAWGFGEGYLNGYGGKVHEGESVLDATLRELREESGVVADTESLERVACVHFSRGSEPITTCEVFFCHKWQGDPAVTSGGEMGTPEWHPLGVLPYSLMWLADRLWIIHVAAGKRIRAYCRYSSDLTEVTAFTFDPLPD